MNSVRWNIAAQGGGRKGDLSRFIEDAVRSYLLEKAAEQAKTATANMGETELADLIDEAVQWSCDGQGQRGLTTDSKKKSPLVAGS